MIIPLLAVFAVIVLVFRKKNRFVAMVAMMFGFKRGNRFLGFALIRRSINGTRRYIIQLPRLLNYTIFVLIFLISALIFVPGFHKYKSAVLALIEIGGIIFAVRFIFKRLRKR